MSKMAKYLRLAIISLVIFSAFNVSSNSFAYWANGVTSANTTNTATVTIGTWSTYEPWDSNTSYTTGDIVTHNGGIYQAKKDGILKEPGVGSWKSDWTQIG